MLQKKIQINVMGNIVLKWISKNENYIQTNKQNICENEVSVL